MNVGDWDAADEDATWVRGIFEVDSYDRLLMNWNNIFKVISIRLAEQISRVFLVDNITGTRRVAGCCQN